RVAGALRAAAVSRAPPPADYVQRTTSRCLGTQTTRERRRPRTRCHIAGLLEMRIGPTASPASHDAELDLVPRIAVRSAIAVANHDAVSLDHQHARWCCVWRFGRRVLGGLHVAHRALLLSFELGAHRSAWVRSVSRPICT